MDNFNTYAYKGMYVCIEGTYIFVPSYKDAWTVYRKAHACADALEALGAHVSVDLIDACTGEVVDSNYKGEDE